ncbi:DUF4190 domain-containing protein [Promicromonospora iranensis]|jgi:hypothetical protein|uniref:DUF4190 domain-containing protein n=1 Tax=Promicromonospora iranensis TaxID=1105144 RepID=UPI0023A92EF0|nr:DUF4190 domain-containing protein [Promicromonospora iranensis]
MTQSDGWKSPYDPPQQDTPGPVPDPAAGSPVPGQAAVPPPYGQPYPDLQQPVPQQPYQQGPYQPYQQPYQQGPAYHPGQPQPPHYGAPYGYAAPPEKNALGVWSLVLGILSIVMLFSCLVGFLAAIPAVITGHMSRKAQKEGLADNGGLALGGLITGWVTIGLTALVVIGAAIVFSIPEFREGFFGDSSSYSEY